MEYDELRKYYEAQLQAQRSTYASTNWYPSQMHSASDHILHLMREVAELRMRIMQLESEDRVVLRIRKKE